MPRIAREKSNSGIYHVIMRGINRQKIFTDEEDNIQFIETLNKYKEISGYNLYAYCLMGNHIHLLIKETKEPLGTIMRRICSSYVLWYNEKHNRIGYLFQDRFKSEPVEDDAYFLTAFRYILQNPVKASMVNKVQDYKWSNIGHYMGKNDSADIKFVLGLFHPDEDQARASLIEFVNQENDDNCLEAGETKKVKDNDAVKIINRHCKIEHPQKLQEIESCQRNVYLKELKETHGLPIRQIEKLTGIGRGIIHRA